MLGAIIGGLLSAGASFLGGMGRKQSAQRQQELEMQGLRDYNIASQAAADRANAAIAKNNTTVRQINLTTRKRADRAAKVPLVEKQTSWNRVDVGRMVRDAENNGFNPLTFLRSGALPLYAQSFGASRTTGHNAMAAALAPQMATQAESIMPNLVPVVPNTQVPSSMEVFGSAAQAGVNSFLQGWQQDQQNQFQAGLVQMQLDSYARRGSAPRYSGGGGGGGGGGGASFNAPVATMAGGVTTNGGNLPSPFLTTAEAGLVEEQPQKSLPPVCYFGICMEPLPGTTSAGTMEEGHGEPVSWAWGVGTIAGTVLYNAALAAKEYAPSAGSMRDAEAYINKIGNDLWKGVMEWNWEKAGQRDPFIESAPKIGW